MYDDRKKRDIQHRTIPELDKDPYTRKYSPGIRLANKIFRRWAKYYSEDAPRKMPYDKSA